MLHDLRFALRQLWRNRSFALVAIVSLGVGIGATTAVFSAVYGLLLSPYPYQGADRMVVISSSAKARPFNRLFATTNEFRNIMSAASFDGGVLFDDLPMSTRNAGPAEAVQAGKLSPNAFQFFGLAPALGRTFAGDFSKLSSQPENAVVLSYRYWRTRYGASRDVVGRTLQLDQQVYTIVGVMPERFRFLDSDVYVPLAKPGGPYWTMLRLKAGVAREAAAAELQSVIQHDAQQQGHSDWADLRIRVASMRDDSVGKLTGVLGALFGAVALLLVIGCVNVSILLVARGIARRHELAVRGAIGATDNRILRQLLTESLALSLLGGLAGAAAGYGFLGAILRSMPPNLIPHDIQIRIDPRVLVFTTIVAVASESPPEFLQRSVSPA